MTERIPAIILAGGRADDQWIRQTGVTSRALLPIAGRSMLEWVVDAVSGAPSVGSVIVVGDVPTPSGVRGVPDHGAFVANVYAGLEAVADQPYALIATSDIPFVRSPAVEAFVVGARRMGVDLVYPIVRMNLCEMTYPGMRRTSVAIREGRFTGGNMVLASPASLLANRKQVEAAHADRKSPLRLATRLGAGATVGAALSVLTGIGFVGLPRLEGAVSRLLGARARALAIDEPSIAADVDRLEDLPDIERFFSPSDQS